MGGRYPPCQGGLNPVQSQAILTAHGKCRVQMTSFAGASFQMPDIKIKLIFCPGIPSAHSASNNVEINVTPNILAAFLNPGPLYPMTRPELVMPVKRYQKKGQGTRFPIRDPWKDNFDTAPSGTRRKQPVPVFRKKRLDNLRHPRGTVFYPVRR